MSEDKNMISDEERDELAEIIDDRWHGYGYNPQGAADAILAAGYRKPHTVTTLGMIPEGAVEAAMSALGEAYGEDAHCREREYVVTALEAAAPYMLAAKVAEAKAEGWDASTKLHLHMFGRSLTTNPYRSQS